MRDDVPVYVNDSGIVMCRFCDFHVAEYEGASSLARRTWLSDVHQHILLHMQLNHGEEYTELLHIRYDPI